MDCYIGYATDKIKPFQLNKILKVSEYKRWKMIGQNKNKTGKVYKPGWSKLNCPLAALALSVGDSSR